MDFVKFENVSKIYKRGEVTINALKNVDLHVERGEFCVILGHSGAGKTTLLNIIGGMDTLTTGNVWLDGKKISNFNSKNLTKYRRNDIGFVFQFYNLLPNLTAYENVEIAAQLSKDVFDVDEILNKVGLEERKDNFPSQLSGGEQQRVAIARALVKNPKVLLCDEPTGALDDTTGKSILQLLQETSRNNNMTVIIITHNSALTAIADRVIKLKNGELYSNELNSEVVSVKDIEW